MAVSGVRVEVADPGDRSPRTIERVTRDGGWGLVLVDSLADRWGLESAPEGGSVAWFELSLGGPAQRAGGAERPGYTRRSRGCSSVG